MESDDRQHHALEVLKSVNKAVTNLRLYSEQSAQALNAVEKAYTELKIFLRLYKTLCFALQDGVPALDGTPFDRKAREQLKALTLLDTLAKAGFDGMTLTQGIDRKRLKQILSFFTATPEQIQKAGGSAGFVENAGLSSVFLRKDRQEDVSGPGRAGNFAGCLQKLMTADVRQVDILSLLHPEQGELQKQEVRDVLKDPVKGGEVLAAAVCFVLQSLQQREVYEPAPEFNHLLGNIRVAVPEDEARKIMGGAASWLTANLDPVSLALLFCQHFSAPLEEVFFSSLVNVINKERFRDLVDFLRQEEERLAASPGQREGESCQLVSEALHRLMETGKGRQLHALELMGMTEQQRRSKRLQAGLTALAQGSLEGLRNKEFRLYLSVAFEQLMRNKKENVGAAILQTLVSGLRLEDEELRLLSGEALSRIGEKLVSLVFWGWLEKLAPPFLHWVRNGEVIDETWNRFVEVLQEILRHAQKTGKEELVDKILPLFYAIRSGALKKSPEAREQVARVQDRDIDRDALQVYLDQCFVKPLEEMHCQRIIMSGPLGIQFLLDVLLTGTKSSERIKLLRILGRVGGSLTPLLLERLQNPMPWYGKRNLLRLLSVTGEENDIGAVHAYLSHEDLRVQSEALSCIQRLSEKKKKQELLAALSRISEKLKFQVVRSLGSVVDEEVVGVLVELLDEEKYFSPDIKTTLLVSICEILGRSGSLQAEKALQLFIGKGDVRPRNMADEVWLAARKAQEVLEATRREQKRKNLELRKSSGAAISLEQSAPEGAERVYVPVTTLTEEREVYELLGQNRLTAAKSLLLDLISTMSYLHQFEQAEALCRRLVEIDALDLEDIVQATEIIEEQKVVSDEQKQGMKWTDVYDFLSTEEFNCLYSVLEHVTYTPDENIVADGDLQQLLFFINKGRAKLYYQDPRGHEILLKTVGAGEVLGGESFFKASAWTVNAASVGTVDAFVLHREALRRCKNSCPGLEKKLESFCRQLEDQESLKVTAINRRRHKRYDFSGALTMAVLDSSGKDTGTALTGDAIDISTGGVSFLTRIALKNIRLLLGRQVRVSLPEGPSVCPLTVGMPGAVVAIYAQRSPVKEGATVQVPYSVHIQFDQAMLEAELALLVSGDSSRRV